MDALLSQCQKDQNRAYTCKLFSKAKRNYNVTEQDSLVVTARYPGQLVTMDLVGDGWIIDDDGPFPVSTRRNR